jgi:hypothetical protein
MSTAVSELSYDARRDPHGLLEDLKRLLRLSHIG